MSISTKAKAIKETDKAILVEDEFGEEHWVPKSCIEDDSDVQADGDEGELVVKQWYAEKTGWPE